MNELKISSTEAAILCEQKQPLIVSEITLPEQLAVGQVLVEVNYSGICGSQIGEIDGVKGPDKYLPHLLGHEGSGKVLQIGPGVSTLQVDDHVVIHWKQGTGINASTPKYQWDNKSVNAGWVTSFNKHAIISENRLTKIPSTVDLKIAALYGCAVTTGFGVVLNDAELKPGQSLVVYGAGGIGLNIIQAAKMVSSLPIVAIDLYDNRLALAKELGADYVINAKNENVSEKVKEYVPEGVDVVIDNTGNPEIIAQSYDMTKPDGKTVLVGVPKAGNKTSIFTLPLHFGKQLKGSFGGGTLPQTDIPKYLKLYDAGRYELEPLISNTFSLKNINDAIASMRDGSAYGRCIIDMSL